MSANAKRIGVSIFLLIRIKVANRVAMININKINRYYNYVH